MNFDATKRGAVLWEEDARTMNFPLTLKVPEKLQLYGLYVYYVVHICDFGMLRVNENKNSLGIICHSVPY